MCIRSTVLRTDYKCTYSRTSHLPRAPGRCFPVPSEPICMELLFPTVVCHNAGHTCFPGRAWAIGICYCVWNFELHLPPTGKKRTDRHTQANEGDSLPPLHMRQQSNLFQWAAAVKGCFPQFVEAASASLSYLFLLSL